MNDNGNRVRNHFEFVLAIHLVSFGQADNDNIVYRTPIRLFSLSISLRNFKSFIASAYGINPKKLYHVSTSTLKMLFSCDSNYIFLYYKFCND
jgi:hypothetical protein